jgi:hypothetical protein
MTTYVSLVNELLRRLNEVTLDTEGDGFDTARNVQALAKDSINNSIRSILQTGQEWPFLRVTYTQTLTAGVNTYSFPSNYSSADWETFYLKKSTSLNNSPSFLPTIPYDEYIQKYRESDDTSNSAGSAAPSIVFQTNQEKFGVSPIPDAAYEVEYSYWSFPADLTLYNDVSVIPNRFKSVIIDGAMMYMMRFRSNEQSASIHQQNFQDGIKTMRRVLIDEHLQIRSTVLVGGSGSSVTLGRVT